MSLITKSFSLLSRYVRPGLHNSIPDTRKIARWVAPTLKEFKRRRDKIGPEPEQPRSSFLEWNYEAELFAFGKRLGEEFERNLLKKALIQREYANLQEFEAQTSGNNLTIENNHELIEEGDSIISNYVRMQYKSFPADIVNAVHKYLTSESMLAHIAKHIGLKDLILSNEFPIAEKTLSDTFKAVVGALKYSKDEYRAENFVKDFVLTQMNGKEISDIWEPNKPYEYLTCLLNEKGINDLEPRLCSKSASNTILACYQVGIYSNKKLLGLGWGESIYIARDTAALDAIHKLYSNNVDNI